MKKIHYRNTRLFTNAGMTYPECLANTELLDMELRWKTTGDKDKVTCKRCLEEMKKTY